MKCLMTAVALTLTPGIAGQAEARPLKVFVLAGQSNMEGHAKIETLDYIGDDPATAPLLQQMRGADGKPRVCDNAWISYFTGNGTDNGEGVGRLTAGYHYLGCAKTLALMGRAFAEANLRMLAEQEVRRTPPAR